MAKKQEDELPMPAGWSKVNKKDFGMSTNILSFIVAGLTLLCVLLCIMHWRFPGNFMEPVRTMMQSSVAAVPMLILAAVPAILLGITNQYEKLSGFNVLREDIKEVPFVMSVLLFVYYLMRAVCLGQCTGKENTKCNTECGIANGVIGGFLAAVAAGTLIYFVVIKSEFDESADYNNLEQKVPEAEPLKL
jgi:uncharacterized membrane protein (DUF485 family)